MSLDRNGDGVLESPDVHFFDPEKKRQQRAEEARNRASKVRGAPHSAHRV